MPDRIDLAFKKKPSLVQNFFRLSLFGWLSQRANAVIKIEGHRNGDCPVCRKQSFRIILWDDAPKE